MSTDIREKRKKKKANLLVCLEQIKRPIRGNRFVTEGAFDFVSILQGDLLFVVTGTNSCFKADYRAAGSFHVLTKCAHVFHLPTTLFWLFRIHFRNGQHFTASRFSSSGRQTC